MAKNKDDIELDDKTGIEDNAEASLDDFFQPAESAAAGAGAAEPSIDDFFAEPADLPAPKGKPAAKTAAVEAPLDLGDADELPGAETDAKKSAPFKPALPPGDEEAAAMTPPPEVEAGAEAPAKKKSALPLILIIGILVIGIVGLAAVGGYIGWQKYFAAKPGPAEVAKSQPKTSLAPKPKDDKNPAEPAKTPADAGMKSEPPKTTLDPGKSPEPGKPADKAAETPKNPAEPEKKSEPAKAPPEPEKKLEPAKAPADSGKKTEPAKTTPADAGKKTEPAKAPPEPEKKLEPAKAPADSGKKSEPAKTTPADAGKKTEPAKAPPEPEKKLEPAKAPADSGKKTEPAKTAVPDAGKKTEPAKAPADSGKKSEPAKTAPADAGKKTETAKAPVEPEKKAEPAKKPEPAKDAGKTGKEDKSGKTAVASLEPKTLPPPIKEEPKKTSNHAAVSSDGGPYCVQIGSYYLEASKKRPVDKLAELGYTDYHFSAEHRRVRLYHVLVGKGLSDSEAQKIKSQLEGLGYAAELYPGGAVKAYSYGSSAVANQTRKKLAAAGLPAVRITSENKAATLEQLRVGRFSRARAAQAAGDLRRAGFAGAEIVRD